MYERAADPSNSPQYSLVPRVPEEVIDERPDVVVVEQSPASCVVSEVAGLSAVGREAEVDFASIEPNLETKALIDGLVVGQQGRLKNIKTLARHALQEENDTFVTDAEIAPLIAALLQDPRALRWYDAVVLSVDESQRQGWHRLMVQVETALGKLCASEGLVFPLSRLHDEIKRSRNGGGNSYFSRTGPRVIKLLGCHPAVDVFRLQDDNPKKMIRYKPSAVEMREEVLAPLRSAEMEPRPSHSLPDAPGPSVIVPKAVAEGPLVDERFQTNVLKTRQLLEATLVSDDVKIKSLGSVAHSFKQALDWRPPEDVLRVAAQQVHGALVLSEANLVLYGGDESERQRLANFFQEAYRVAYGMASKRGFTSFAMKDVYSVVQAHCKKSGILYDPAMRMLTFEMIHHHKNVTSRRIDGVMSFTIRPHNAKEVVSGASPAAESVGEPTSMIVQHLRRIITEVAAELAAAGRISVSREYFIEQLKGRLGPDPVDDQILATALLPLHQGDNGEYLGIAAFEHKTTQGKGRILSIDQVRAAPFTRKR